MLNQGVRMKKMFLLSFATISFLGFLNTTYAQKKNDPFVANVEGVEIKKSQFDKYYEESLSFVSGKIVTKESALNDLIDKVLGIKRAKANKIQEKPEVIEKIEEILYHAQISQDLEAKLLKITVSDDEVKKYYAENPEYNTSQILLRVRVVPSPEEVVESSNLADEIYKEALSDPNNFNKLAAKYGQSANAPQGGDLGFQPKTRLTPEYYKAIKGAKNGFITKPFRSQYGFHIVKVLDVKPYSKIDMNMYKKIIYDIKRDKILEDYFASFRKKAKIVIHKENL